MALGALAAVEELGRVAGRDVLIVSIDGLREAVEHVIDGKIAAVEYNNAKLAALSFDAVEHYAAGQVVPPRIVVQGYMIDRTNAAHALADTF
jgi:ribose transport system substrate-binding protein